MRPITLPSPAAQPLLETRADWDEHTVVQSARGRRLAANTNGDELVRQRVGNYRIESRLAAGGMGVVYRGKHVYLSQQVAIKVLPAGAGGRQTVARLFAEAAALGRIDHPCVIRLCDFGYYINGSGEPAPYLVTELLLGETLARRLRRPESLRVDELIDIAFRIAIGLQASHSQGVVHRDLSTANIYVYGGPDGRTHAKIFDFGLAKFTDGRPTGNDDTAQGSVLGTPDFMSPEQCAGHSDVDHRADIYALGCVLFAMAFGHAPYAYHDDPLRAHRTEPVPVTPVHGACVPPALGELIRHMLCKNPAGRPQTMADVIDELNRMG